MLLTILSKLDVILYGIEILLSSLDTSENLSIPKPHQCLRLTLHYHRLPPKRVMVPTLWLCHVMFLRQSMKFDVVVQRMEMSADLALA